MKHATEHPSSPRTRPLSAARVLGYGRLPVDHANGTGPLDETPLGTLVTATGTITRITMAGTNDAPRAFATLSAGRAGTSATVNVGSDHYLSLFGYLVEDTEVEIEGTVRQPFEDWPPLIDATGVRPLPVPVVAGGLR